MIQNQNLKNLHKSKILKAPQGNLQSLKANIWILLNYWGSKFWNKCFSASCVRSKDVLCYRQIKCKAHVNSTMNKRSKESPALWLFTTIWEDCSFPCPVWKSDTSLNSWEFKFHPIKSMSVWLHICGNVPSGFASLRVEKPTAMILSEHIWCVRFPKMCINIIPV